MDFWELKGIPKQDKRSLLSQALYRVLQKERKKVKAFLSWNCNQITILNTNYCLSYSSIYYDNNNSSPMPFYWADGSCQKNSRIDEKGKLLEYLR